MTIDVETIRWPDEGERRAELARLGTPRLLVVADGAAPPLAVDPLEDWVREQTGDLDRRTRAEALVMRATARRSEPPVIDDDGVLRHAGRWVSVPPIEARLVARLIERFGNVVGRDDLARVAWDDPPSRNVLDVHMLRLRRRLEEVRLSVKTVRSRGYLLERT